MAQLRHPLVTANPLWSANLANHETHLGHWADLRSRLQHPAQDLPEHQFGPNFCQLHGRPPHPDDVPTWHRINLTEISISHGYLLDRNTKTPNTPTCCILPHRPHRLSRNRTTSRTRQHPPRKHSLHSRHSHARWDCNQPSPALVRHTGSPSPPAPA